MPEPSINTSDPATPPAEPMAVEPQPTTEASITLPPQECMARAEQALSQTQERIRALGEQLAAIEPRRADLAEHERQAAEAADLLARQCAVQPNLINAAQARLLVVVGTPAEESARQALSAARKHAEKLVREEAEARAVLAATRVAVAQEVAQIDADAQRAEAERSQLVGLVEHLQHEVVDARRAVFDDLLATAGQRAAVLRAEVEAAQTRLAEAQAVLEQHQANAAATLASYPDAHEQARQAGLMPDEAPGVVERLLVAFLAYLRALEAAPRLEAMPLFDHQPLSAILGGLEPGRLHYALTADRTIIAPQVRYVEYLLATFDARRRRA